MISRRNPVSRPALAAWPIVLMLHGFFPAIAFADEDPSAAETAAARTLAVDGLKLAKAGQCQEAVDKLERAEKLHHSPIVLSRLGDCYISLGKLVQGTETLRKMLREPLPPEPTPALQQAYDRAQALLQETKASIAGLTIMLTAPKDATPTLTVDGGDVPATVLGVELPVDPGEHTIEVRAPGFLKAKARAKLGTGEKQTISLELKRDPNAPSVQAPADGQAAPSQQAEKPVLATTDASAGFGPSAAEPAARPGSGRTWGYLSYGLGAVGLGVGIVFGRAAMQDKSLLDDECPGKVCPEGQREKLDSAKTKGLVSTIGFGVGAAGVVLGTVLVLTSGPSTATGSSAVKPRSARSSFRPRAAIGLGSVELGADF